MTVRSICRQLLLGAILVAALAHDVTAQAVESSTPTRSWNVDLSGTVGVRAGIGSTMTGVDVSGAVTVVRTVDLGQHERRGRGLTVMFDVAPGEWSALAGPRWDVGNEDGTAFLRVLAGVRRLYDSSVQPETSESVFSVGAGIGAAVADVLLWDVNWIVSPTAERAAHRLTVSLGFMWHMR